MRLQVLINTLNSDGPDGDEAFSGSYAVSARIRLKAPGDDAHASSDGSDDATGSRSGSAGSDSDDDEGGWDIADAFDWQSGLDLGDLTDGLGNWWRAQLGGNDDDE